MTQEPERNLELAEALRRLEGDPPFEAIDWDRLRTAISARAQLPLARLRRGGIWWEYTARWARAAIPLATAAAITVLAMLPSIVNTDTAPRMNSNGSSLIEREGLALAVTGDVAERDVFDAVAGPTDREWLLEGVMEGGER